jgi:hypothetical protein
MSERDTDVLVRIRAEVAQRVDVYAEAERRSRANAVNVLLERALEVPDDAA